MSVFVCWSGDRSHALADAVKALLRSCVPSLQPKDAVFISDNIAKGDTWFSAIEKELDSARAGIVCLVAENLDSRWLHFEAGALGRKLAMLSTPAHAAKRPRGSAEPPPRRLFTLVHDLRGAALEGPLSAYQATITNQADMSQMVLELARVLKSGDLKAIRKRRSIISKSSWKKFELVTRRLFVPVPKIVPGLDAAFQRKTFTEPVYRCADKAWLRRYDGARETRAMLLVYENQVEAACAPYEQAVFKMLLKELDGYAMTMQSLLHLPGEIKLLRSGELNLDAGIREICETRRLAVNSLAMRLLHPLDEPLRDEAVRFMRAETDEERKMIVHSIEGVIRREREAVYDKRKKAKGTIEQLIKGPSETETAIDYRASSWDLDRIFYYLLVQYFGTATLRPNASKAAANPSPYEWVCAARDVQMEVERYRAKSKGASQMPLTYALAALEELKPGRARDNNQVRAEVEYALQLTERDVLPLLTKNARAPIEDLVKSLQTALGSTSTRGSAAEAPATARRAARTAPASPTARPSRPRTRAHRIRRMNNRGR